MDHIPLDLNKLNSALAGFNNNTPFSHCVIDDLLHAEIADLLEAEFLNFESNKWHCYSNALELKKTLNDWNQFPKATYALFQYLMSREFVDYLSENIGMPLYADPGLHGGGWHVHGPGGNLNPHLDYSIHPKLGLQRKLNLIIYMSKQLLPDHGGHLGLWAANEDGPGVLVKEISPVFNRAVLFDTTQNSWHGLSRPLTQPDGIYRKSLAVYYLCDPPDNVDRRSRALFAPRDEQKNDEGIRELIAARSDSARASQVYRT